MHTMNECMFITWTCSVECKRQRTSICIDKDATNAVSWPVTRVTSRFTSILNRMQLLISVDSFISQSEFLRLIG